MPDRFHELAVYNSERDRGIMHTPEKQAKMRLMQLEFDLWSRASQ